MLKSLLGRLKVCYVWATRFPMDRRTVLVAEPLHEPNEDGFQWFAIYRVWLDGHGRNATEVHRQEVYRTIADTEDVADEQVKIALAKEEQSA